MPYVNVIQRSGLGQWTMMKKLTTSLRSVLPTAPAIMPARPKVAAAVVTQAEAVAIARRVAAERVAAQTAAAAQAERVTATIRARFIPTALPERIEMVTVGRPYVPTAVRIRDLKIRRPIPLTYAHRPPTRFIPFAPDVKTESGSTYKTTQVEVVPGPDIHAPTTGQSISLRETEPIVSLTATTEGIQIADETEPTVPTFVEAAAVAPSALMKYALLAVGGYILYDSFVKSKPKRRKRRRRR